jgi:HEAT repeat protein
MRTRLVTTILAGALVGFGLSSCGEAEPTDPVAREAQTLIKQLRAGNPRERREAAEALAQVKHPSVVEPLIEALEDHQAAVQAAAMRSLGVQGATEAVDELAAMAGNSDEQVRFSAIQALARLGDASVESYLVTALADESEGIALSAAEGLAALGDSGKAQLQTAFAGNDPAVAKAALHGLSQVEGGDVDSLLAQALSAATPLRILALQAMAERKSATSVSAIIPLLADSLGEAETARLQAERPAQAPAEDAKRIGDALAGRMGDKWGKLPQEEQDKRIAKEWQRESAARINDQKTSVLLAAVEALGAIGGAEARAALIAQLTGPAKNRVAALIKAMGSEARADLLSIVSDDEADGRLRNTALGLLADDQDTLVNEAMLAILRTGTGPTSTALAQLRQRAVGNADLRTQLQGLEPIFIERFKKAAVGKSLDRAAAQLVQVAPPRSAAAAAALRGRLAGISDAKAARGLIKSLAVVAGSEDADFFAKLFAETEDVGTQISAAQGLIRADRDRGVELTTAELLEPRLNPWKFCHQVLPMLAATRDIRALPAFERWITNPGSMVDVRSRAIDLTGRFADEKASRLLIKTLADPELDSAVKRDHVAPALIAQGAAAVPVLLELVRDQPRPEQRGALDLGWWAAEITGGIGAEALAPTLALLTASDGIVVARCLRILRDIPGDEAGQTLAAALDSADKGIRGAAARFIGQREDASLLPAINTRLASEADPTVSKALNWAAGQLNK